MDTCADATNPSETPPLDEWQVCAWSQEDWLRRRSDRWGGRQGNQPAWFIEAAGSACGQSAFAKMRFFTTMMMTVAVLLLLVEDSEHRVRKILQGIARGLALALCVVWRWRLKVVP